MTLKNFFQLGNFKAAKRLLRGRELHFLNMHPRCAKSRLIVVSLYQLIFDPTTGHY
jgi:hypothetical protein